MRNTLRVKMYTLIIASVVVLSVIAITVASAFYSSALKKRYEGVCRTVCETTAGLIQDQNFEAYVEDEGRTEYIELRERVLNLKNSVSDVDCITVYSVENDGMQIFIDTSSKEERGGVGNIKNYDNTWNKYKQDLLDGKLVKNAQVNVNTGLASMYCMPVGQTTDGHNIYVCVGVPNSLIQSDTTQFSTSNRNVVVALALLILVCALIFVEKRVIKPVKKLAMIVDEATERKDVGFVQEITERKIETKNELENLYLNILKIYASKARIESAAEKADPKDVNSMLSLIKRMDHFAASHLDNSLQYIILLMGKMRNSEKYKDILTDKLYEDILLAAPLHDIGKLAIPDEIVNKPARLTDEEYKKMKDHARYGAKIIDELYLKYSKENYLYLAREIALNHHERWDGTGYPDGKKGEEISLAVRIVSIADVFDALVSERVYKKPYTFEESMGIIESYRGTFFDPDIAQMFVSAKNEVYNIYNNVKNKS